MNCPFDLFIIIILLQLLLLLLLLLLFLLLLLHLVTWPWNFPFVTYFNMLTDLSLSLTHTHTHTHTHFCHAGVMGSAEAMIRAKTRSTQISAPYTGLPVCTFNWPPNTLPCTASLSVRDRAHISATCCLLADTRWWCSRLPPRKRQPLVV